MTPNTPSHRVYPDGPPCQANCPGPWSSYHEGYADGYERSSQDRIATEAHAVHDMQVREALRDARRQLFTTITCGAPDCGWVGPRADFHDHLHPSAGPKP